MRLLGHWALYGLLGALAAVLFISTQRLLSGDNLFDLLDLKSNSIEFESKKNKLEVISGEIKIEDITFSYSDREKLFHNFYLKSHCI